VNLLSVEDLSKNLGERWLFQNLNFGVLRGDKTALVAGNGSGKTTLLKILAGKESADSGAFSFNNDVRWAYLPQEPDFEEHHLVKDVVALYQSNMKAIEANYEKAIEADVANHNNQTQKTLADAMHEMDVFQVWDYERRLVNLLDKFGIKDMEKTTETLSGGEKKRLALALILVENPEFLILDEPTNHLDLEMIEWLEDFLSQSKLSLLMVTHDRYFLDRVCNQILELHQGKLYKHEGNYSYFLEKQSEREEVFAVEYDKAKKLMKKELEWIRRQPKARGTKAKYRVEAFEELKEKVSQKKVEKTIELDIKMSRIGGKVLELKKARKSYGNLTVLDGFDYVFKKGERIGIIGKNGVGKSTFIKMLCGEEQADSGKINPGDSIVFGMYRQEGLNLPEDKKIIDLVREHAERIELSKGNTISASQFLTQFLFPPEVQYTNISKLSGGEKRRLMLLLVLIKNPNFLILDEPTNDLDLITLSKLEDFLENYSGCLLIVSHDRYFMDRLVDHLFIFEGEGIVRDFNGTYSEFKLSEEQKAKNALAEKNSDNKKQQTVKEEVKVSKLSYKEKLELEQITKEIHEIESKKLALMQEIESLNGDYDKIQQVSLELEKLMVTLDSKSIRWFELSEKA
jgi:ATP-binding cassette subfamily F protein uup